MYASTRTETEKLQVAEQLLGLNNGHRTAATFTLKTLQQHDMLTVIGHEDAGFVIVANDDDFQPVVGYSQAPFSVLPPAVKWYIAAANASMQHMKSVGQSYTSVPPSSEYPDSLGPLVKTTWNQSRPYNNLCPGGNGSSKILYPTGCVATAMAQVMNYYKYPERGIGEHQYSFQPASGDGRIIYANFGETKYDWDNMLDKYDKTYTDEQATAVATLMLHCGVSVDMQYTASGSGSYAQECCLAFKKYFGYNPYARVHMREYYSIESWMKMIYEELNNNGPFYYSGSDKSSGGHAFVLDGYNNKGLVHINWGWGGSSDGFFDIALLNPSGYEYSQGQVIILGINPAAQRAYESQVVASNLSFIFSGNSTKRVTISGTVYNGGAELFKGQLACVLENAERTLVLKTMDDVNLKPIVNGTYWTQKLSLPSNNLSEIPDGTYRLFAGSRTEEDSKWQLIRPTEGVANSYIVKKSGNDITYEESTNDLWATAVKPIVVKGSDAPARYFDIQGREVSKNTRGLLIRKQGNDVRKVMVK